MRSILFNSLKILVGILLIVMLIFTPVNGFFFIVNAFGGSRMSGTNICRIVV